MASPCESPRPVKHATMTRQADLPAPRVACPFPYIRTIPNSRKSKNQPYLTKRRIETIQSSRSGYHGFMPEFPVYRKAVGKSG